MKRVVSQSTSVASRGATAIPIPDTNIRAVLKQQFSRFILTEKRGTVQRRSTVPIPRVDIRPCLKQQRNDFSMPEQRSR